MVKILTINICILLSFGFAAGLLAQTHLKEASRAERQQTVRRGGGVAGYTIQAEHSSRIADSLRTGHPRYLELGILNSYVFADVVHEGGYSGTGLLLNVPLHRILSASLGLKYWFPAHTPPWAVSRRTLTLITFARLRLTAPWRKHALFAQVGLARAIGIDRDFDWYEGIFGVGYRCYLTDRLAITTTLNVSFMSSQGVFPFVMAYGGYSEIGLEITYKMSLGTLKEIIFGKLNKGGTSL